jgi:Ni/Fe-hydrogenase subunit HybB-like protein
VTTRASGVLEFVGGCGRLVVRGSRAYYAWLAVLGVAVGVGAAGYLHQSRTGLLATNMRDQVSWGFYVSNFTFLVGVAAAAVLLVIPAYVYHWGPIKEVVILGELLAISALVMCLLFILADLGRPDRFLHIVPLLGTPNWPRSMLTWDAAVLNGYLALNLAVVTHILYRSYHGRPYDRRLIVPLVLLSIPGAISIHTVTAFLYNGMGARPYWNASILAPRFIASAFCSGPAVMIIVFQILRKAARMEIKDEAIHKVAELMAYAMFVNLFLLGAEIFKEYYSGSEHLRHTEYLWSGLEGHRPLVPFAWISLVCSAVAFVLFLVPRTRRHPITLNLGCGLIWTGVYIEKGICVVLPGMTPDTLGEIYEYTATLTEWAVGAGIFGVGFLVFTLLVKIAVPIMTGTFREDVARAAEPPAVALGDAAS